jgi:immune inhibitor A
LLIWYWDTSFAFGDNSVGDHPGEGYLLPVDSHPAIENFNNGATARPRLQSYDATFGLQRTEAFSVHDVDDGTLNVSSKPPVRVFNDTLRADPSDPTSHSIYWVPGDPGDAPNNGQYQAEWNSVNVPNTGTKLRVVSVGVQGSFMQVHIE